MHYCKIMHMNGRNAQQVSVKCQPMILKVIAETPADNLCTRKKRLPQIPTYEPCFVKMFTSTSLKHKYTL